MTRAFRVIFMSAGLFGGLGPSDGESEQGIAVQGTIVQSWQDRKGNGHERGFPGILPVRLCSFERVLETHSNDLGSFVFSNVPAGVYELSTGTQVVPPRTIKGIEIKEGQPPLRLDIEDPRIMSVEDGDCFRDTPPPMSCNPTWFRIEYGTRPSQSSAGLIAGRVTDWDDKHAKGLRHAKISLRKTDDPATHYSAVSDKRGEFQFAVPAGVYDLDASLDGFQDVKVRGFLVPRENTTSVTLLTRGKKVVTICQ